MKNIMNSKTSEFVFSAPAYLCLISNGRLKTVKELRLLTNKIITDGVNRARSLLKEIDYPMMMSLLFNAFTEKGFCQRILEADKFGFDNLYSDSGGLQIITRGLSANSQAKEEIYQIQAQTDLTMCFDEIPIKSVRATHRASYTDRVFIHDDLQMCAKQTSKNVIEQVDAFRKMNSKTKIFFIVQGNTFDDMAEWFEVATKTIPEDYWDHIGGVAIGGTCIGAGQREDVEKLAVYRKLRDEFDPRYVKKHLHALGVGSASRLIPMIILRNTGFIPEDTHVSYDSTTLSMAYIFGNFINEFGEYVRDTPYWEDTFKDYYQMITPVLIDNGFSQDEMDHYYPIILKDMLCHDKVYANHPDDRLRVAHQTVRTLTNIFQIVRFTKNLHRYYLNWDQMSDPIGMLKQVTDMDSFFEWESEYAYRLMSKRVTRKKASVLEETLGIVSQSSIGDKSMLPRQVTKRSKASLSTFWEG